jgi:hypothetical protein
MLEEFAKVTVIGYRNELILVSSLIDCRSAPEASLRHHYESCSVRLQAASPAISAGNSA